MTPKNTILARDVMGAKVKKQPSHWYRHFIYRKESWRTTWKLRLLVLLIVTVLVVVGRPYWTKLVADSLVCHQETPQSDALLLENFDPDYLVFEKAEWLKQTGVASRVFVPSSVNEAGVSSSVEKGTVELLARIAGLRDYQTIPMRLVEPISLNAATQIRDALVRERIRSVVVVAPGFRSRRSALVYRTVLEPAGIRVGCYPVFGVTDPANWTRTWHGIQNVLEHFTKLQYYRLWVLR